MKKMKFVIALLAISAFVVGCAPKAVPQTEVPATSIPTQEVTKEVTLKDKIENFDNYSVVTDGDEKAQIISTCEGDVDPAVDYSLKVQKGTVKKLYLYESKDHAYDLFVYLMPNYGLDKAALEKVSSCGELGANFLLKILDGYSIWGYPNCDAGAVPSASQPGYKEHQACSLVEKELADYLGEK